MIRSSATSAAPPAAANQAWRSPPILGTIGIPHRLSCKLRTDTPITITLKLHGRFDGKAVQTDRKIAVGKEWQDVHLDFTPPNALTMSLQVSVSVPEGAVHVIANYTAFKDLRRRLSG